MTHLFAVALLLLTPALAFAQQLPQRDEPAVVTDKPATSETKPAPPPRKSHVQFLVMCLLLTLVGVAAIALLKGWV